MPGSRVQPLPETDLAPKTLEVLAPYRDHDGEIFTIWRTLAHHQDALRRFIVFGNHVLGSRNTIPLRSRELIIVRIASQARAGYEWDQHVRIARSAGLDDQTILAAAQGDWAALAADERLLLRASDALMRDRAISDPLWAELSAAFSTEQIIDLLFTVGQYQTIATIINTLDVAVEGPLALAMPGDLAEPAEI